VSQRINIDITGLSSMKIIESREIFIGETRKLLRSMELVLIDIEENASPSDSINLIFRNAHSIKGSSGLLGLDLINTFIQIMEKLLIKVRNNELGIDMSIASLLASCADYLYSILDALEETADEISELADPDPVLRESLIYQLNYYIKKEKSETQAHSLHRVKLINSPTDSIRS
jgi:two-component system chemotaxis sensor kinase CheA